MPKLTATVAAQVNATEAATTGYLLPEGRYAARLAQVEQKEGAKGPYWVWTFQDLHDTEGEAKPGRQWHNTSLSEKSFPFLKATFEALGYTTDSDTDEMIGEWVTLHLIQEQIARGKRAGEMTNRIRDLIPFDATDFEFDPAQVAPLGGATATSAQVL